MVFLLSPAIEFVGDGHLVTGTSFTSCSCRFWSFMAHAATARVISIFYIALMAAIRLYTTFGRRSSVVIAGILAAVGGVVISVGLLLSPLLLSALGRNATLSGTHSDLEFCSPVHR